MSKEKIGNQKFVIQRRFQIRKKIENPSWIQRLLGGPNEDRFEWEDLNTENGYGIPENLIP